MKDAAKVHAEVVPNVKGDTLKLCPCRQAQQPEYRDLEGFDHATVNPLGALYGQESAHERDRELLGTLDTRYERHLRKRWRW
jgi:hypothetical protein